MSAFAVVIMIVLGIFMPSITIALLPIRVGYLLLYGSLFSRIGGLLLLVPWGYWLMQILKFGYVSAQHYDGGVAYGSGPTVNPGNWIFLSVIWAAFEVFVYDAQVPPKDEQPKNRD